MPTNDEVINALLDKGASANDISDKIKDMLFAKSAKRVDDVKQDVSASLFADQETESEPETANEVDQEEESND
tara:strand:- start:698 stop:916 length:219 start_codon:yes stop_codon:yes gene_type:complete